MKRMNLSAFVALFLMAAFAPLAGCGSTGTDPVIGINFENADGMNFSVRITGSTGGGDTAEVAFDYTAESTEGMATFSSEDEKLADLIPGEVTVEVKSLETGYTANLVASGPVRILDDTESAEEFASYTVEFTETSTDGDTTCDPACSEDQFCDNNGVCQPLNTSVTCDPACSEDQFCDNNGVCQPLNTSVTCDPACSEDQFCDNNGVCQPLNTSVTCDPACSEDQFCDNNGVCQPLNTSVTCDPACSEDQFCDNNGVCQPLNTSVTCDPACSEDQFCDNNGVCQPLNPALNTCRETVCETHGTCTATGACDCDEGWTGDLCSEEDFGGNESITFTVYFNGNIVPDVEITVGEAVRTSNENGVCSFEHLEDANLAFRIARKEYDPVTETGGWTAWTKTINPANMEAMDITLQPIPEAGVLAFGVTGFRGYEGETEVIDTDLITVEGEKIAEGMSFMVVGETVVGLNPDGDMLIVSVGSVGGATLSVNLDGKVVIEYNTKGCTWLEGNYTSGIETAEGYTPMRIRNAMGHVDGVGNTACTDETPWEETAE